MTIITASILRLDEPTWTGLTYPTAVVEAALKKSIPTFGTLGEPNNLYTDMDQASHVIERVYVEDGWLKADVRIIDTPCGRVVADKLTEVEFKPAGLGRVDENKTVSDYSLIGVWAKIKDEDNQQQQEEEGEEK